MMTQELNVCVLAAPLAAIDRRSLSQAWYSALHCVPDKRGRLAEKRIVRDAGGCEAGFPTVRALPNRSDGYGVRRTNASSENAKTQPARTDAAADRRAKRSSLARRIERKFLNPRPAARRATFTVAGKRVHVMVQASPGQVRLVAICAPALREAVARALAQARFALASRGVACS